MIVHMSSYDDSTTPSPEVSVNENIPAPSDQAQVLLSLEEMIKTHINSIDRMQNELKEARQMFEDGFINDPTFREIAQQAKDAANLKSQTRQQILKQPTVAQLQSKIKNLATDIKERKEALSDYLLEYQRMAGVNEIEGYDGEIREIINQAKLIKKFSKDKKKS